MFSTRFSRREQPAWRTIVLACLILIAITRPSIATAAQDPAADADAQAILQAVRAFGDNVLAFGRDTYGPKHTPLFVDGIDIVTHQAVQWKSKNGQEWALSDLGNQQNLMRTLCGLSALTGNPQYKAAAKAATHYAFDHLRNGKLLAWGGHMAYNATADTIVFAEDKGPVHELKAHYPYYELMWEVDPAETRLMIENIWNSHVLDWRKLDFNRHGNPKKMDRPWDHPYDGGPVFFDGKGLTFINAGSDLYYAAAMLSKLEGGAPEPLAWAKRLAHRYVETRDPKTGIGGYQFSQCPEAWCDDVGKLRGDRAQYQYAPDFPGHHVVEGTLFPAYGNTPHSRIQVCNLAIAEALGESGKEFKQWAVEEMTAWGKSAYRKADNSFIPMLTDGTSMEGYVIKKDGYYGSKGRVLTAGHGGAEEFWAYARGYQMTGDPFMWEMARTIAAANQYGELGEAGNKAPALNLKTTCADTQALLGFLALHEKLGGTVCLDMARAIGRNILKQRFVAGYFGVGRGGAKARFDAIEPLALLQLAATIQGRLAEVPTYPGGEGFFAAAYDGLGHKYDAQFLYR